MKKYQAGKLIAFDVHTHGAYGIKFLGGSGALVKDNLGLKNLSNPSDSDFKGSTISSVRGFQTSAISTNNGYRIYSTKVDGTGRRVNSGNTYDVNGNLRKK